MPPTELSQIIVNFSAFVGSPHLLRLRCLSLALACACTTSASGGSMDIDGVKIHFESLGEGPPVVFIHDGGNHSEVWENQRGPFSNGYNFVAYDRRGYGRSDIPTKPYSNTEDLSRLLDHNHIDKAVLVGSSSGGGIALKFTLAHPDKVAALVLVGAVVEGLGYSDHFMRRDMTNFGTDEEGRIDRWIADPWIVAPENTEAKLRHRRLMEENPQNFSIEKHWLAAQFEAANPSAPTSLSRLHEIRVPTLIVTGEADIPDVHVHAGAMESGIDGARREVIKDAGHLVYIEQPDAFNEAVLGFLSLIEYGTDVERGFAPVRDTWLYYEIGGEGTPVVFLNGGLMDHRMWDDQVDAFSERFRVIRYDMQTTGLSKNVSNYSNSDDLKGLLDHLGIDRTHLIGLSGGARAAIDFAIDNPRRVDALVLVSPGLNGYEFQGDDFLEHGPDYLAAFRAVDTHRAVEAFQRMWTDGHRSPNEVDPRVRERVRAMALSNAQPGRFGGRMREIQPPAIDRLNEISARTLVVTGVADLSDIHVIAQLLRGQISDVNFMEIRGSAHMVNMEKPDEFNHSVIDFLNTE